MGESKLIEAHQPCPCGKSSDAYSTYDDGHGFCFSCSRNFKPSGEVSLEPVENEEYYYHPHRGISEQTFSFYNAVTVFSGGNPTKIGFVYPNNAVKFRSFEKKEFYSQGPMGEAGCFGIDKFDPGSKESITITEGEYDALSAFEITRGSTAAISVRSASSAKRDCTKDYDYINSFRKIILAFDNDEPGQTAARSVASLFDFSKVYHVKLNRHKDANAYLVAGEAEEFYQAWSNAKRYSPDNIISTYAEFAQSLVQTKDDLLATYPFEGLNSRLYGLHRGEVVVFKGDEGIGKTEFFRAMEYHVLSATPHNIGVLHLEEDNGTTLKALAGYHLKVPTTLPDSQVSNDEALAAIKELTKGREDRLHIHSSWDVEDENAIIDNIRYLASAAGCSIIFLDHISWLATGQDDDDERKKLDRLSQKFKLLAKELHFAMVEISHVNDNGKTRGSRNITKNANTVIHLSRDITSSDPNESMTTHMMIEKARLGGNTGYAGSVIFDRASFTLRERDFEDAIKVPNL